MKIEEMKFTKKLCDIVDWRAQGVDYEGHPLYFAQYINYDFEQIPREDLGKIFLELDSEKDILESYWATKENGLIEERKLFQVELRLIKKVLQVIKKILERDV